MVGIPQVNSTDAVGVPPVSSEDIPSRVAVIAAAYAGTLEARFRVQTGPIITEHIAGPLPRSSRHTLANTRIPLITQRCEASNPGTYDTIDISGVTGTAVPAVDASVVPRDEYEAYWRIVDGGTIGTAGITYYESNDGGRTLSGLRKLGTATSLAMTTEGIKVDLNPPTSEEAVVVAHLNEMVTDFQAHVILTAGSVHGAADPAAPYTIGVAADYATSYTVFGQLRTSALTHVGTIGTTHGAADATATAAITAIAVPATPQALIAALAAFKLAFFGTPPTANSGHTQRTASAIHGAQDGTNLVTTTAPVSGTLLAGDIIRAQTFAPYPSVDDLAAAFLALATSDHTPGIVLLPGRTPASYAGTITAGLDLMKAKGKPCECIVQARRATSLESQQELRDAVEIEVEAISDKRLLWCTTDALCTLTEGSATLAVARTRFVGFASNFAVRRVINNFWETTWKVSPPAEGVRLVDGNGVLVGHDEPKDVPTRLQLLYRVPDSQQGRPTVFSIDYSVAGEEDREKTQRANLIRDEIERVFNSWAWSQVGTLAAVTVLTPTTGKLNEGKRQDLQRNAAAALAGRGGLSNGVSDIDAPDLVTVDPFVTLDGDVVTISAVINWTPIGAIGRIDSTISARVGS